MFKNLIKICIYIAGITGPRGRNGLDGKEGKAGTPGLSTWAINGTVVNKLLIPPEIAGKFIHYLINLIKSSVDYKSWVCSRILKKKHFIKLFEVFF